MNVWLVKLDEPLPIDEDYRPYRMGMLADALIDRGHSVTRWVSDRMHLHATNRFGFDTTVAVGPRHTLEILSSKIPYKKSVSILRFANNIHLAYKFKHLAFKKQKPDLIVCAMPTPELAKMSTFLGTLLNVPVIIDARDYWPDIIENELGGIKKFLSQPFVFYMKKNLRFAAQKSTSLVGITKFYRDHLISYANRPVNHDYDLIFPLGFSNKLNILSDTDVLCAEKYWRELIGRSLEELKIIYFAGRFSKTVFNALSSIEMVVQKLESDYPNLLFVFCGSGNYEQEIRRLFKYNTNVVMPGELGAKKLSYIRSKSYAALQPVENRIDYHNSLSNKFFECMSSGLPIITPLKGETECIVNAYNIGYVYDDGEDLFRYLAGLCENEQLRDALSAKAKTVFMSKYSSEVVYNAFVSHCENVVAGFQKSQKAPF